MPFQEVSKMSLRLEFVTLASQPAANIAQLCRRYGISRPTGYKWLERYRQAGAAGLCERSRRPHSSPRRSAPDVEAAVLGVRAAHPCWGGRKIKRRLEDGGHAGVPAASTVTAILHRHAALDADAPAPNAHVTRFERARPNELWQMDFKGHFATATRRCHPLTVLDDHSRFALALIACADERGRTVRAHLEAVFRRYGLPEALLADNGPPWGAPSRPASFTALGVWLLRLGIRLHHGRPYHPQTQGKDERFHRTLAIEVLQGRFFAGLEDCQRAFDAWRVVYNHDRPHEALGLAVPASRYAPSPRPFPEALPLPEYGSGDRPRKVNQHGYIHFQGRRLKLPEAFAGFYVGLRPTATDGLWTVHFAAEAIAQVDLRDRLGSVQPVNHVSEHL
ncbi:IS481 family transposase [Azospirillum sp.]|uniref:IS481 family transposase n=1 Tax=Azospirillum sp. TaxID=34012 RepID=UPI002D373426|nr:IS481 family transposase [Azospirillum sp.]HYD64977.1 IS481 family transposase [Azospirillum sp.]